MRFSTNKKAIMVQVFCLIQPMLSSLHPEQFVQDDFLIVENYFDQATIHVLRARCEPLFHTKSDTGVQLYEWNWCQWQDAGDLTHHI